MESQTDWYVNFKKSVEQHSNSRREYKLFNIDRLIRSGKRVDEFSATCKKCTGFKQKLDLISRNLGDYISGTKIPQKELENISSQIFSHLRKDHKIIPRSYFIAVYSFAGMLFGVLAGFIAGLVLKYCFSPVNPILIKNAILIGWFTGLVIGQIFGNKRDKKVRKENRQL
jgi:hypothetical protein